MPDTCDRGPCELVSLGAIDATAKQAGPYEAEPFAEVYRQHFPFVWRCAGALGVPKSALDDACQDVFLVVHRRFSSFRGEAALRSWIYGIVRNIASNYRRGVRRRGHELEIGVEIPSVAPTPFEHAASGEAGAFVQEFLQGTDSKKRDVFVLALVEQLSVPEVAATLGIPLNTAYTRLRSVRLEFQQALARRGQR